MTNNKETYEFYKDYILAAERDKTWWGCILNWFSKINLRGGLYYNASYRKEDNVIVDIPHEYYSTDGTLCYPFEEDDAYFVGVYNRILHKNPYRLAFVRDMIKIYEENNV